MSSLMAVLFASFGMKSRGSLFRVGHLIGLSFDDRSDRATTRRALMHGRDRYEDRGVTDNGCGHPADDRVGGVDKFRRSVRPGETDLTVQLFRCRYRESTPLPADTVILKSSPATALPRCLARHPHGSVPRRSPHAYPKRTSSGSASNSRGLPAPAHRHRRKAASWDRSYR